MEYLSGMVDILPVADAQPVMASPPRAEDIRDGEITVTDLVDIAIPANAQAAAETLGLKVQRSVTSGAWVRRIPRDEAEIAVECLRDSGFSARIVNSEDNNGGPAGRDDRRAA
jgi:hypothetical protein